MPPGPLSDPDGFLELIRRAPMLEALRDGPLARAELEERLGISRATSHRFTRSLGNRGLIERVDGEFQLTLPGEAVTAAIVGFKAEAATALRLAPVLEVAGQTVPPFPLQAFTEATVTSADHGDPHAPMARYVSLVRETATLRGFDTWAIAPTYLEEIQDRILDGMVTELIDPLPVVEDIMDNYPERCVEVCVSGYLTIRLHDALPFGLAVFDDRVGIAVRDPDTGALRTFVDTDASAAREWADATYERFKAESVLLEDFTKKGLREAVANR